MIGKTLAHYEILSAIGRGGMGEVWRARDTKLGREVAIKTLPEEFARDADRLARFEREAKLLASLNHPNIAAIYGLEEHEGSRFLVLELVPGDTLEDRIRRGALPVEESLKLALQIAEALEAAHEKGVVHRDLKPANIKVTPDGNVKVLDFGLAKAFEGDAAEAGPSNSPTLSMAATQAGVILGTAAYMSPEQAKGLPADRRADVFSFGCVLFEMLTGQMAFQGELATEIMASVINQEPDYATLQPNLHPRIKELLRRCFEKNPKNRWQAVGDIRFEIEQVLDDPNGVLSQHGAETALAVPISSIRWVAALIAGALIAGVAGWNLRPERLPEQATVSRFDYELPPGPRPFGNPGFPALDIAANGEHFVYAGSAGLMIRPMGDFDARLIPGTDDGATTSPSNPVFSPDAEEIAYITLPVGGLRRIGVEGGEYSVLVPDARLPFGISWERGGTILYGQVDGIWSVPENGGTPIHVIPTESDEQAFGPRMLPGGEWLMFTLTSDSGTDRWDEADIVVQSLVTGDREVLVVGGSDARYLSSGHLVYAVGDVLWGATFDLETRTLGEERVPVLSGVQRATNPDTSSGSALYGVSDRGTLVYVPGTDAANQLRTVGTWGSGGGREDITDDLRVYSRPRMSPDRTMIAVEVTDAGGRQIWLIDADSGVPELFTTEGSWNQTPVWTPDSQTVVFASDRLGETANAIYRKPADLAGGATWILQSDTELVYPGDVSLNGVLVYAESNDARNIGDIWTVDIDSPEDSRQQFLATPAVELAPNFSPDGRWLAYTSNEGAGLRVEVRPFPMVNEGILRVIAPNGSAPVWSSDGAELYWMTLRPSALMATAIDWTDGFAPRGTREVISSNDTFYINVETTFGPLYDAIPDSDRFLGVAIVNPGDGGTATAQINIVQNWFVALKELVPVE
jgi:serine/threonine protein kinase